MVRALVIRLGEALEPVQARLEAEVPVYEARRPGDVILKTHDAPVSAVGNLSKPVQLLREQLEEALLQSLTELLALAPGRGADFVLDVYVLLNLGEPLVANATSVIVDMLAKIVDQNFRTIFPRHRTGTARRFRVIPIAILPAAADCEKARDDAVDELQTLYTTFSEAREDGEDESFVDRVFLLDALTSRGIASRDDLVDQVMCFLRLAVFGGVRRSPDFVRMFEAPHDDLFATFGIVCGEVDYAAIDGALTERMKRAVAATLGPADDIDLPGLEQLLPVRVLDDPDLLDRTLAELEALPLRTLEADGSGAVGPLIAHYDALGARAKAWRETDSGTTTMTPQHGPPEDSGAARAFGLSGLIALIFGGIVAAVVHFVALMSVAIVIGSGVGVALVAFIATWFVVKPRTSDEPRDSAPQTVASSVATPSETQGAVIDVLEHAIDAQRTKLRNLLQALAGVETGISTDETGSERSNMESKFRSPLVSPGLEDILYNEAAGSAAALAQNWLRSIGSWQELLDSDVRPSGEDLDDFCAAHFDVGARPIFGSTNARDCVAPVLKELVQTWTQGVGLFLEGESRVQFDPDGFDIVFDHSVFAPKALRPMIGELVSTSRTALSMHRETVVCEDVFIVSAATGIHPDAVAPLADRGGNR